MPLRKHHTATGIVIVIIVLFSLAIFNSPEYKKNQADLVGMAGKAKNDLKKEDLIKQITLTKENIKVYDIKEGNKPVDVTVYVSFYKDGRVKVTEVWSEGWKTQSRDNIYNNYNSMMNEYEITFGKNNVKDLNEDYSSVKSTIKTPTSKQPQSTKSKGTSESETKIESTEEQPKDVPKPEYEYPQPEKLLQTEIEQLENTITTYKIGKDKLTDKKKTDFLEKLKELEDYVGNIKISKSEKKSLSNTLSGLKKEINVMEVAQIPLLPDTNTQLQEGSKESKAWLKDVKGLLGKGEYLVAGDGSVYGVEGDLWKCELGDCKVNEMTQQQMKKYIATLQKEGTFIGNIKGKEIAPEDLSKQETGIKGITEKAQDTITIGGKWEYNIGTPYILKTSEAKEFNQLNKASGGELTEGQRNMMIKEAADNYLDVVWCAADTCRFKDDFNNDYMYTIDPKKNIIQKEKYSYTAEGEEVKKESYVPYSFVEDEKKITRGYEVAGAPVTEEKLVSNTVILGKTKEGDYLSGTITTVNGKQVLNTEGAAPKEICAGEKCYKVGKDKVLEEIEPSSIVKKQILSNQFGFNVPDVEYTYVGIAPDGNTIYRDKKTGTLKKAVVGEGFKDFDPTGVTLTGPWTDEKFRVDKKGERLPPEPRPAEEKFVTTGERLAIATLPAVPVGIREMDDGNIFLAESKATGELYRLNPTNNQIEIVKDGKATPIAASSSYLKTVQDAIEKSDIKDKAPFLEVMKKQIVLAEKVEEDFNKQLAEAAKLPPQEKEDAITKLLKEAYAEGKGKTVEETSSYLTSLYSNEINKHGEIIKELGNLKGSYSDNKGYIDALYNQGYINDEEYTEINGEGFWNGEEDMGYVANLMKNKQKDIEIKKEEVIAILKKPTKEEEKKVAVGEKAEEITAKKGKAEEKEAPAPPLKEEKKEAVEAKAAWDGSSKDVEGFANGEGVYIENNKLMVNIPWAKDREVIVNPFTGVFEVGGKPLTDEQVKSLGDNSIVNGLLKQQQEIKTKLKPTESVPPPPPVNGPPEKEEKKVVTLPPTKVKAPEKITTLDQGKKIVVDAKTNYDKAKEGYAKKQKEIEELEKQKSNLYDLSEKETDPKNKKKYQKLLDELEVNIGNKVRDETASEKLQKAKENYEDSVKKIETYADELSSTAKSKEKTYNTALSELNKKNDDLKEKQIYLAELKKTDTTGMTETVKKEWEDIKKNTENEVKTLDESVKGMDTKTGELKKDYDDTQKKAEDAQKELKQIKGEVKKEEKKEEKPSPPEKKEEEKKKEEPKKEEEKSEFVVKKEETKAPTYEKPKNVAGLNADGTIHACSSGDCSKKGAVDDIRFTDCGVIGDCTVQVKVPTTEHPEGEWKDCDKGTGCTVTKKEGKQCVTKGTSTTCVDAKSESDKIMKYCADTNGKGDAAGKDGCAGATAILGLVQERLNMVFRGRVEGIFGTLWDKWTNNYFTKLEHEIYATACKVDYYGREAPVDLTLGATVDVMQYGIDPMNKYKEMMYKITTGKKEYVNETIIRYSYTLTIANAGVYTTYLRDCNKKTSFKIEGKTIKGFKSDGSVGQMKVVTEHFADDRLTFNCAETEIPCHYDEACVRLKKGEKWEEPLCQKFEDASCETLGTGGGSS